MTIHTKLQELDLSIFETIINEDYYDEEEDNTQLREMDMESKDWVESLM